MMLKTKDLISLADFKIAKTKTFQKKIKKSHYNSLYSKISNFVDPILKKKSYFGPNIKRLKVGFKDVYRFRIGDPLLAIRDHYPKFVISMDEHFQDNIEGVKHINLYDFLMLESF